MQFWKKIYENRHVVFFAIVYAFILTMANEFFFASERMQNWDQAIYQYIGHLIVEGKMPYVDAFDHKGPLLYIIYALGYLLNEKWGSWLINYLFMIAMLCISYKVSHKFVGKSLSVIICFIIYSGFITLDFRGGTPEFYAGLFVALSLYYMADFYKKNDISRKSLMLLGISGAAIFWLKHSVLITILIFCFLFVVEMLWVKRFRDVFKYLFWYGLGFISLSAVICIWVFANHAGMEMIEDYFIANISYAGDISMLNRAQAFLYLAFHASVVLCWGMLLLFILFKINASKECNKNTSGNIIFHGYMALVLTLLFFAMPGRNYYHYLSSLFPLMTFIMASVFSKIQIREIWKGYISGIVGLALVFGLIVYPNLVKIPSVCADSWTADQSRQEELAVIEQYAKDNDEISVLGGSAGQYLASDHESATSYPYIAQAVLFSEERVMDYREQIINNKPVIIITEPLYDQYQILGYDILRNYYLCKTIDSRNKKKKKNRVEGVDDTKKLSFTIDMETYLNKISQLNDCTVLLAVKDTSEGISEEALKQMKNMGLEQPDKFVNDGKRSFIGIIQNGKFIYQKIGNEDQVLYYEYSMQNSMVHMESKTLLYGNQASIKINDVEYAVNSRGWNMVVYNNKTHELIDSVVFDTYDEQCRCYR